MEGRVSADGGVMGGRCAPHNVRAGGDGAMVGGLRGRRGGADLARLGDCLGEPRMSEGLIHRQALGGVDYEQLGDQLLGLRGVALR